MKKVIAFAASNSKNSINKIFVGYAANKLNDVDLEILDMNDFILPLYSPDLQADEGIPEKALKFRDLIHSADGVILSLPEHNGGYSAAFKNLWDWNSRIDMKFWAEKPILVMAASPGPRGGMLVLRTALEGIPFFGGRVVSSFSMPSFYENFKDNTLEDEELENLLVKNVKIFQQAI